MTMRTLLLITAATFGLIGFGCSSSGGGGGDTPPTADTTSPTIASASSSLTKTSGGDAYQSFSATVTDNRDVQSVTVAVSGDGSGNATLSGSGSSYTGQVQVTPPILGTKSYSYTITATDLAGNKDTETGTFTVSGNTPPSTGGAPF
ncbi:MAG: Ig-like domain-containing protein [Planctomycetota bacterium]|jgi:hypothetical protein|nr:Ig-like domain-containing protein [Planctomycetota bacterium]